MTIERKVVKKAKMEGTAEVIFDRYAGDNTTKLAPEQKMYLSKDRVVSLPHLNIMSLLTAVNTESAPKILFDPRKYRGIASAVLSSVIVSPPLIPFTRNGKPIVFGEFDADGVDPLSGVRVVYHVARLPKGIPNPKVRPMLGLPWALEFDLTILPHPDISLEIIERLFVEGGYRIGIGTHRKMFGKFEFSWE